MDYRSRFHEFIARIIANTCDETGSAPLDAFVELVTIIGNRGEPPRGLEPVLEELGYPVINGEIIGLSIRTDEWYERKYGSLERAHDATRSGIGQKYITFLMSM